MPWSISTEPALFTAPQCNVTVVPDTTFMRIASATVGAETVKDVMTGVPVQPGGALFFVGVGVGEGVPGGAGAGVGVFVGVADGAADELVAVGVFAGVADGAADELVAVGEGLFSATEGLT